MAKKSVMCPACKQVVKVKTLSILTLLVLLLFGIFPGVIYFVWRVFGAKKCPNCGCRV